MHLIKSPAKQTVRKNVKAEVANSKPVKQAAYPVKREAAKKK
jgi:hypothetical protein